MGDLFEYVGPSPQLPFTSCCHSSMCQIVGQNCQSVGIIPKQQHPRGDDAFTAHSVQPKGDLAVKFWPCGIFVCLGWRNMHPAPVENALSKDDPCAIVTLIHPDYPTLTLATKQVLTHTADVLAIAFRPDGKELCASTLNGKMWAPFSPPP